MSAPFTLASLRDVLKTVLSRRQRMPGDAELERLAAILNGWCRHYASIHADDADELLRQEGAALKTLAIVLPRIRARTAVELEFFRDAKTLGNVVLAKEQRLGEIEMLWRAVRTAMQSRFWNIFWEEHGADKGRGKWRDLQDAIAQDFITAMRPNNPGEKFGLTETGVLARYVAAVVPSITGEVVKASSVGQHRKRAARK